LLFKQLDSHVNLFAINLNEKRSKSLRRLRILSPQANEVSVIGCLEGYLRTLGKVVTPLDLAS
jgi:hypothetical protein